VELNELFNLYWRRIIPPPRQTSNITFLFSRLDREPFCGIYRAGKDRSGATGLAGDNRLGMRTSGAGSSGVPTGCHLEAGQLTEEEIYIVKGVLP